jgi:hypothetical protein
MAFFLDFYALNAAQLTKVRRSEGVEGLRKRCEEFGEHLGRTEFATPPNDLFDALDQLLDTKLSDLLGTELGDLDGGHTNPKVGHLSEDDMSDAMDQLDRLGEAIDLDPDEEDDEDYDRVQLYELRKRAEEMASDLDLVFDDDFAALLGELVDNLRAARDEDSEIIAFVNG